MDCLPHVVAVDPLEERHALGESISEATLRLAWNTHGMTRRRVGWSFLCHYSNEFAARLLMTLRA